MLYLSIILAANIVIFRLTTVDHITVSDGIYIIPIWFVLADIVAEVYGYKACRKMIFNTVISVFIFSIICILVIRLPIPPNFTKESSYNFILGNQIIVCLNMAISVIIGGILNAFLITRWKALIKGKYFWLRSVGASWIGQLFFTLVTVIFNFYKDIPWQTIVKLMLISYPIKMTIIALFALPAIIAVKLLKAIEKIDIYDNSGHNPLKIIKII